MATQTSIDINEGIKELIVSISSLQEGTDIFSHTYKHSVGKIKKFNTMYFLSKGEVDRSISGMADKFNFHGFSTQAKCLQEAYGCYVHEDLAKAELMNRLNIVKFLLCMSESPTKHFLENPDKFVIERKSEKSEIDWAKYLNEDLGDWVPSYEDSTDDSLASSDVEDNQNKDETHKSEKLSLVIAESREEEVIIDFSTSREELLNTIQHTWFNQNNYYELPFSDHREANIGILWERFLEKQTMGLVSCRSSVMLSEYKVIREVLWQLWVQHESATFRFDRNTLTPRCDVTLSSVRSQTLYEFLKNQFMPYINILEEFRLFSRSMDIIDIDSMSTILGTYRSYDNALLSVISQVYGKLCEFEDRTRGQEATYTLLCLAHDFELLFEPMIVLHKIHKEVVTDTVTHSSLECAVQLISRLHIGLQTSVNKLEQNLRLALFLESLYHYFSVVDSWLMKNDFLDYSNEFPITRVPESQSNSNSQKLGFQLTSEQTFCNESGIIKIIKDDVLQIGRSMHLLRLLGKYSLLESYEETIHQEFVRRSLKKLGRFFDMDSIEMSNLHTSNVLLDDEDLKYKHPVIIEGDGDHSSDMNKLENIIDTTDGFLMVAFEEFFIEKKNVDKNVGLTLFERICQVTPSFFPVTNFFEDILKEILDKRFAVSSSLLKTTLVEEHLLGKQLRFLRHVFLFFDDLIFPFYRKLFQDTSTPNKSWGNTIRLTSLLQDTLMDMYPEFYEKCTVTVCGSWNLWVKPLEASGVIQFKYEVEWPLNIVIHAKQMECYKEIFQFLLKLKWGLYTINHLFFSDIESKRGHKTICSSRTAMKLKYLKFCLTNLLNSIQHYVFSFVFFKHLQKFEVDFAKSSDLYGVISSHKEFIDSVHSMVMEIRNAGPERQAFSNIMLCIANLKAMWIDVTIVTLDTLNEIRDLYVRSDNSIRPIICPVYLLNY